jgi:hypothetical protein
MNNMIMKIKSIKRVGIRRVYDISVADVAHYILKNGVVTHNTGIYYSANTIWIIGRQQDKDDKELKGYHFIINVEKSRDVKEKSKIPITVNYNSGINKWSGLLDLAIESGHIVKPKVGWYAVVDKETGELGKNMRAAEIVDNKDIWTHILENTDFPTWIQNKYTLSNGELIHEDIDD